MTLVLSHITGPTIESPESADPTNESLESIVNPVSSPITGPPIDPTSILVPLSSVLQEPSSSIPTKTKAGEPTLVY